jgi:hypothetical protein
MPTTTPAQALRVPISTDNPDVVDDMTQLALQIEKRLMGVYATAVCSELCYHCSWCRGRHVRLH